jgi:flagellar assembly protein FliH
MISLSNLIKSTYYVPLEDVKQIESIPFKAATVKERSSDATDDLTNDSIEDTYIRESINLKEQMLEEAEQESRVIIQSAQELAERLKEEAKLEISRWWEDERAKDAEHIEQAHQSGYKQGYDQGQHDGQQHMQETYKSLIAEGTSVLEHAYEAAKQTIASSEPFLLELSCKIAEKIIGQQIELSPEYMNGMIQEALKRSRDKGTIVLCVSPSQYAYVQSVRDELTNLIDAQAELQILPDASIQNHGCVVKTAFGSIDARVETQLTEIKEALLDLCRRGEQGSDE